MHEYHEGTPHYDERQVLFDGCEECEARGADPRVALGHMDPVRFRKAYARATAWNRDEDVGPISEAERAVLEYLWTMQVMLERHAGIPIGYLPDPVID